MFFALVTSLPGCSFLSPEEDPVEQEASPVRWIVVEKRAAQLVEEGILEEGQIHPESTLLTMQPLYPDDLKWVVQVDAQEYYVEVLEIMPRGEAAPGEMITAIVRVGGAKAGEIYRLEAVATSRSVRVLGEQASEVRGSRSATFRFTNLVGGRGGISIRVERVR